MDEIELKPSAIDVYEKAIKNALESEDYDDAQGWMTVAQMAGAFFLLDTGGKPLE